MRGPSTPVCRALARCTRKAQLLQGWRLLTLTLTLTRASFPPARSLGIRGCCLLPSRGHLYPHFTHWVTTFSVKPLPIKQIYYFSAFL